MNPYKVLGVSENATDEEVRSAYLKLVKKYHPDKYVNNPLADLATEKLKQINEAYDTITAQRAGKKSSTGGYDTSAQDSGYSGEYANEFNTVRSYINSGNLEMAARTLDKIQAHNAEWNYLYGLVYFRTNRFSYAKTCFETAIAMDPNNAEYRRAYDTLIRQGNRNYHTRQYGDGVNNECDTACSICSTIWCLDSCCSCLCRG